MARTAVRPASLSDPAPIIRRCPSVGSLTITVRLENSTTLVLRLWDGAINVRTAMTATTADRRITVLPMSTPGCGPLTTTTISTMLSSTVRSSTLPSWLPATAMLSHRVARSAGVSVRSSGSNVRCPLSMTQRSTLPTACSTRIWTSATTICIKATTTTRVAGTLGKTAHRAVSATPRSVVPTPTSALSSARSGASVSMPRCGTAC